MTPRSALDRAFESRGHEIIVRAPSRALLEWLEEFQAPWFGARVVDAPSPASVVDIRVDAELFRGRVAAARLTGQDAACFTMDRDETWVALARLAGGSEIAVDTSAGIALGARTDERGIRRVDVLAVTECSALRLAVLRVVRELASAATLSPAEARARLLECGLVAGGRSAPFLTGTPTGGCGGPDASLPELATAVPSLHCVLGHEAYVYPSVWEAIRQASASAYQRAHA